MRLGFSQQLLLGPRIFSSVFFLLLVHGVRRNG